VELLGADAPVELDRAAVELRAVLVLPLEARPVEDDEDDFLLLLP
jgi:hypothetical protein